MYYGISFSPLPRCDHLIRFRQRNGWNNSGGINTKIGVVFAVAGSADFCVDGKTHHLTAGDWLFMPVGSYYKAHTDDFFEFYSLTFVTPLEQTEVLPHMPLALPAKSFGKPPAVESETIYLADRIEALDIMDELMRICREMHRLILHPGVTEGLMFDLYFGQILLLLSAKVMEKAHSQTPPLMKQAIDYIHEHFRQPLSLEEVCAQLHVSKSYLARLFRRRLGMTVTNYINNVKLDYSVQLLGFSGLNVSETAEFVGYQDAAYFSRLFSKRFGVSPIKFRLMSKPGAKKETM